MANDGVREGFLWQIAKQILRRLDQLKSWLNWRLRTFAGGTVASRRAASPRLAALT